MLIEIELKLAFLVLGAVMDTAKAPPTFVAKNSHPGRYIIIHQQYCPHCCCCRCCFHSHRRRHHINNFSASLTHPAAQHLGTPTFLATLLTLTYKMLIFRL